MTVAHFSLADASLAQTMSPGSGKKTPLKRTTQAMADQKLAPEPR